MSLPDWCVKGAPAVVYVTNKGAVTAVKNVTIKNIGKYVTVNTYTRFKTGNLLSCKADTWWTVSQLIAPDDPRAAAGRRELDLRAAKARLVAAIKDSDTWEDAVAAVHTVVTEETLRLEAVK